jgi:hypothetical protein
VRRALAQADNRSISVEELEYVARVVWALLNCNTVFMYRRQLRERQKKLHAKLALMRQVSLPLALHHQRCEGDVANILSQERDARISAHTEEEARARALVAGMFATHSASLI